MIDQLPINLIKEGQWIEIKMIRSRLLVETDYTQMPDSPLDADKKAEFAAYRQLLRDLPQSYSDPLDVIWPKKPTI
ncbi:phage tail assembly chaperone [Vibrio cholerae]|nr:phage tail assembly chaperone [Vibrio cholerae]